MVGVTLDSMRSSLLRALTRSYMVAVGSPFAIISEYLHLFCYKPQITLSLLELVVYCVWLACLLCLYGGALLYMRGLGFFNMVEVIRVGYKVLHLFQHIMSWPKLLPLKILPLGCRFLVTILILVAIVLPKLKTYCFQHVLVMIYLLVRNYIVLPERPTAWR